MLRRRTRAARWPDLRLHRPAVTEGGVRTITEAAYIEIAGHSILYRSAGSGPPLVLLHGFLCDSRVWRRQLAELADEFDVVAWDAPGAGLSPDPPAGFGLDDWAICLARFLEALGLGPAHIVGLSWGGLL